MKRILGLIACLLVGSFANAADFTQLTVDAGFGGVGNPGNSTTSFIVDETTDSIEFLFQCAEPTTITTLDFLGGTRTGSSAGPVYQVALEGINASGRADGTIKSATNAKGAYTPPTTTADNGVWKRITLTSSYTCTRGEFLAEHITCTSGCTNLQNMSFGVNNAGDNDRNFPVRVTFNNTGTVTSRFGGVIFGYESASKVYGTPVTAVDLSNTQFSSDSSPNEYALNFTIPAAVCSTFQVSGVNWAGRNGATGKSVKFLLYDTGGAAATTVKQTATYTTDYFEFTAAARNTQVLFQDTTLTTLNCGSNYRISVQPQATATNVSLPVATVAANSDLAAYPGGINWYLSTRVGGNWTDVTTKRPILYPIITDMTAPVGGNGNGRSQIYSWGLQAGQTSVIKQVKMEDSSGAAKTALTNASLTCQQKRGTGAASGLTLNGTCTTGSGTFVDSCFKEVTIPSAVGFYELHLPDALLAAGADHASINCTGTGFVPLVIDLSLRTGWNANAMSAGVIGTNQIVDGALTENKFASTGTFVAGSNANTWILTGGPISASSLKGQMICHTPSGQCRRCDTYSFSSGNGTCAVASGISPGTGDGFTLGTLVPAADANGNTTVGSNLDKNGYSLTGGGGGQGHTW